MPERGGSEVGILFRAGISFGFVLVSGSGTL